MKAKLIEAFNAVDQLAGQLVLPVAQGAGLVSRLQALASAINSLPDDPKPVKK